MILGRLLLNVKKKFENLITGDSKGRRNLLLGISCRLGANYSNPKSKAGFFQSWRPGHKEGLG